MNRTAKLLGVSTPTIQAWLEQFAAAYAQKPALEGRAVVIDLNETRHLVDWGCSGRDKATCERLIQRLTRWRTRLSCADDDTVYDVLLPVGQLHTGKNETHGSVRDNARQRHRLARFRRRSIAVSKAERMVDVSIALFAGFAGNNRIGNLLSMLASNRSGTAASGHMFSGLPGGVRMVASSGGTD
jgi:insertion element IS1 protein InsB